MKSMDMPKPAQGKPEEEAIEIDVSELEEIKPEEDAMEIDVTDLEEVKPGAEFTKEEIEARHKAMGEKLAAERAVDERFKASVDGIEQAFFAEYPSRDLQQDPEAMTEFREMLAQHARIYVRAKQTEPDRLMGTGDFKKELLKKAEEIAEKARLRKFRRAA